MVASVLSVNACGATPFPAYPARPISDHSHSLSQEGLVVAVRPVTSEQEAETYFGTDLLSNRVLAVFLTVENQTPMSSFIVSKDRIALTTERIPAPGGAAGTGVGSPTAGMVMATVSVALVSPLGAIIAAGMVERSNAIRHNLLAKEFRSDTISPGQTARGFLYFQIPESASQPGKWKLHIEALDTRLKQVREFDLLIDWRWGR